MLPDDFEVKTAYKDGENYLLLITPDGKRHRIEPGEAADLGNRLKDTAEPYLPKDVGL